MPKPETITGPSGKNYEWTQPPRRVHWKHGRAGRTFAAKVQEIADGEGKGLPDDEKGLLLLESMSDAEAARLEAYANDVLTAGLGYSPDDLPDSDFWHLFGRSVYGVKEMKVETAEGKVSVEDVDVFADELLRQEDPEPLELLARAIYGGPSSQDDDEPAVYVDGQRR